MALLHTAPAWNPLAVMKSRGWFCAKTNEHLVSRKFSDAEIDRWTQEKDGVCAEPIVESKQKTVKPKAKRKAKPKVVKVEIDEKDLVDTKPE
mgnify:CR=1 FL=1